jgi:hypothetical protein
MKPRFDIARAILPLPAAEWLDALTFRLTRSAIATPLGPAKPKRAHVLSLKTYARCKQSILNSELARLTRASDDVVVPALALLWRRRLRLSLSS